MTLKLAAGGVTAPEMPEGPLTATCDQIPYHSPLESTPMPEPRGPTPLRVDGYDILDRLGSGGMGVVFKARHRQLNRVVALKMLGRDALADPESHRRFQAEAEAVARLQHPNIIQVFDVGTFADGPGEGWACPYLSLEYVDGGSLFKQTLTPQDPTYSARLLEKVARAVHAAHQVGVVHRDLKPANVLLTGEGEPKIADFGLAKQIDHRRDERGGFLTQDGTAVGTPEYMAPEQVDGLPATPAFDTYSLGVMLYELLTARQPFKGLTITETMLLVKYQEPVPPSRLRPTLPKDLETICLKCMAKDPARRYATAEELADDLARWLAGKPILARPVSGAERLGRWAKRNPSIAGLAAVAFALAVFGVSGVTWKWREAEWHARMAQAEAREAELRRQAERWELYRANIAVASAGLRLNTLSLARDALGHVPDEHRSWEWRYYRHQLDTSRQVYPVGGSAVTNAARMSGGRVLIHQRAEYTLWDLDERKAVRRAGDPSLLAGRTVSPDGRRYARGRGERGLAFGPIDTLTDDVVLSALPGPAGVNAFSADGRCAVVGVANPAHVRVWDTTTGKPLSPELRFDDLVGVWPLSADGRLAAANLIRTGDTVVWDVATGERRFTIPDLHDLFWVRFSPDGKRLHVNEAYPRNRVRVWDTATGEPAGTLAGHTNNIQHLAHSPDGTLLATASRDQTVRLWRAADGQPVATLRGHTGMVHWVEFSPDGRRVVSAAGDTTARIWDVASGGELAVLRGHTAEVLTAAFVDAGDAVASVSTDGTVRYWDSRPGVADGVWAGHTGFAYSAAFHPDGRRVVSAAWDGTARVWDTVAGEEVLRLDHGRYPDGQRAEVCSAAVHPGGTLIATLCKGDTVRLWDADTGELVHTWPHATPHWKTGRLAFDPTGKRLAAGFADGTVHLFDVADREEVAVFRTPADAIRDVTFSPDGRWLATAGDSDMTVRVWDVARREQVAELTKHDDAVYVVTFSPDGKLLVSGSLDGNAQVWRTDGWKHATTLPHGVKVYGLAFTPDNRRLACGCADNTVRLWDVQRFTLMAELRGHNDYVHTVAFSPDGHRLLTASGDMTVRTWDAPPPD